MKIVIAGAGEVGTHLAKLLINENQDIIVIDNDESKLAKLEPYNMLTHVGNPVSFKTMRNAGAENCDLFIAVTPYETDNVLACEIAKSLGAEKAVARIDNYDFLRKENRSFFNERGIDDLIYPEYLAAEEIAVALKRAWVRNWFELCNGELVIIGVKIRDNAKLVGMPLRELFKMSNYAHISAIKRNHETIIPRGDDFIRVNDIVYIATTNGDMQNIRTLCGKADVDIKKIMIMGGSRIAVQLAMRVGDDYKITIIESDYDRCEELADRLPDCNIIHGDGRNFEILEEEGIEEMDAFIALTDSSETNILGCLAAKEYGVKKTIAEVENIQFISEAEALNIGTVINKKLLASSRIFQFLLDSDSSNAKCLALADAEVAEMIAKKGSKITQAKIKDLNLSRDLTIAGMLRNGKGSLVQGDTQIQEGDHVVVFCLSGAIHKVEKLFN
ncbi:MAG: Trk system potassium transporter TrkA [Muribaculaceae bacterium]|nr:Trk system potassium transporter TrkA [Muribaculaceae bacterium]